MANLVGGTAVAVGGVVASDTGAGAIVGVPAVITGVAEADLGATQIAASLLNANADIPSPTPESVVALASGASAQGAEQVSQIVDAAMFVNDIYNAVSALDGPDGLEMLLMGLDSLNQGIQTMKSQSESGCSSN